MKIAKEGRDMEEKKGDKKGGEDKEGKSEGRREGGLGDHITWKVG